MRVTIDDDKCQGHGRCYAIAPAVFDADDQGRGVVINTEVGDDLAGEAESGVANCPESAISVS